MFVFKILAAHFVAVLAVIADVVSFLLCMQIAVLVVAFVMLTMIDVALVISSQMLG